MLPKSMLMKTLISALIVLSASLSSTSARHSTQPGVLLLAHGGSAAWDANVATIAAEVNKTMPTEVALGMATRANIQAAVTRLEARGRYAPWSNAGRPRATRSLIVPVLLSYGGIEVGIRKRLDGLTYQMSAHALAPDSRLVDWVRAMAQ